MRLNDYRIGRLDNGMFMVSAASGGWFSVTPKQLAAISSGAFADDRQLLEKMEQAGIALTKKGEENALQGYSTRFAHLSQGISLHIVNPSLECNLSCPYCYANASPSGKLGRGLGEDRPKKMDKDTAKKTVDFIFDSPSESIVIEFQGGEPLSNFPMIQYIVEYAREKNNALSRKKGLHFRIVSNLTLMDHDIARWLASNSVLDVCTSLDGPKEVHDANRKFLDGKGTHEKVVYWVNALRHEYGFPRIGLLATITRNSLSHPREIVDEYLSLGMNDLTPNPIRRAGRADKAWDSLYYSAEEYLNFWKEVVDYCISLTKKGKYIQEQYSVLHLQKLFSSEAPFHTCFSKPCGAGLMQCSYSPNGDVYTCDEAKAFPLFKLGNVADNTYKEVFTSPSSLNMVGVSSTESLLCNACVWNPYCSFCPVSSYATQGNIIPKLSSSFECRVKKGQLSWLFDKMLFSDDSRVLNRWLKNAKV